MIFSSDSILRLGDASLALEWWDCIPNRDLVIQVPYRHDIGAIKRLVISHLGVPGFNHATKLKYNGRMVKIESIFDTTPLDEPSITDANIFYVGYLSGMDEVELRGFSGVPYDERSALLLFASGIDLPDIVRVLRSDGWSEHDIAVALLDPSWLT